MKLTTGVRPGPRTPFGVRFSSRNPNPGWLAIALLHASGVRRPQGVERSDTPGKRYTRNQRASKRCEDILDSCAADQEEFSDRELFN